MRIFDDHSLGSKGTLRKLWKKKSTILTKMMIKNSALLSAINQRTVVQYRGCHSIKIGSKASLSKVFSQADIEKFAKLSLDDNAIHLDADAARKAGFEKQIVHGLLVNGSVS